MRGASAPPSSKPPPASHPERRLAEEVADAVHGRAAQEDLERDSRGPDDDAGDHDRDVLEQDRERDQHDAESRQRVEAGERRGGKGGGGKGAARADRGEQPEDGFARPVLEQQVPPRLREALEAADQAQDTPDEALPARAGELDAAPAPRQPDLLATGDELDREQDRDDLEDVGGPAGGEREGGHPEEQDEDEREALAAEDVDEAAKRGLAIAVEEALEV